MFNKTVNQDKAISVSLPRWHAQREVLVKIHFSGERNLSGPGIDFSAVALTQYLLY